MATAKKLPSGNYRVLAHATVNGKGINQSFTASTKAEAEHAADEWQQHCKLVGSNSSAMTVKDAMEAYIECYGKTLSPSTVREYDRITKSKSENDLSDLKDKKLLSLTCPIIKASMNKCTVAPKTIKNRYGFLQRILSVYYPKFIWSVDYPKIPKKKKPAYSMEYIRQILDAVKNSHIEIETYLGMLSMRESEIGGLMWQDIDFKNKSLDVCRSKVLNSKGKYEIKEYGKNDLATRTIYLPDKLIKLLKQKQKNSNSEYVSSVPPNQMWLRFNRRLYSHGMDSLPFHKLRHIYSSLSSALEIDTAIRMENGGWANETIMNGTYRHPLTDKQIDANEKINTFFK